MIIWHHKLQFPFCTLLHGHISIHRHRCGLALKAFEQMNRWPSLAECNMRFLPTKPTSNTVCWLSLLWRPSFDLWALCRPIHIEMSVSIRRKRSRLPSSSETRQRCLLGTTVISWPSVSLSVHWGNRCTGCLFMITPAHTHPANKDAGQVDNLPVVKGRGL